MHILLNCQVPARKLNLFVYFFTDVENSYTWLSHKTHSHTKVTLNIYEINKLPQNLYAKKFYFLLSAGERGKESVLKDKEWGLPLSLRELG
jgi:hypothetical protein